MEEERNIAPGGNPLIENLNNFIQDIKNSPKLESLNMSSQHSIFIPLESLKEQKNDFDSFARLVSGLEKLPNSNLLISSEEITTEGVEGINITFTVNKDTDFEKIQIVMGAKN